MRKLSLKCDPPADFAKPGGRPPAYYIAVGTGVPGIVSSKLLRGSVKSVSKLKTPSTGTDLNKDKDIYRHRENAEKF